MRLPSCVVGKPAGQGTVLRLLPHLVLHIVRRRPRETMGAGGSRAWW